MSTLPPGEQAIWKAINAIRKRLLASSGGFVPSAHADEHASTGDDPLDILTLDGYPAPFSPPTRFLREDRIFAEPEGIGAGLIEPHGITVDGGGSVLTTGVKGRFRIPFDYEIVRWSLLADQAGDVEFDVKVSAFGGSPASIVASAPPVLSGADEDDDVTLAGWTTTGSAGDEFQWEITGTPDAITRVSLILDFERT